MKITVELPQGTTQEQAEQIAHLMRAPLEQQAENGVAAVWIRQITDGWNWTVHEEVYVPTIQERDPVGVVACTEAEKLQSQLVYLESKLGHLAGELDGALSMIRRRLDAVEQAAYVR